MKGPCGVPQSVDVEDQVLSRLGQCLGEHRVRHRLALEHALTLVLGRDGGLTLVRHAHEKYRLLAARRLLALVIKLVRALVYTIWFSGAMVVTRNLADAAVVCSAIARSAIPLPSEV